MRFDQKGFAVLEGLLILVIIAIIGGIGWYAVSSKHQTDRILSQADKISQSTPVKSQKEATQPQSQKYLTIKEWGIRAAEPPINIEYTISGNTADFSSPELDKLKASSCGGSMSRYLSTESVANGPGSSIPAKEKADIVGTGNYAKVGDYYFFYSGGQGPCFKASAQIETDKVQAAAGSLLKTLEAQH